MASTDNGNGMSVEARTWRAIRSRVRWVTLGISLLANAAVVSAVVGWHASAIYSRLAIVEKTAERTEEEMEAIRLRHVARMAAIEDRQQIADNLAARLEERLISQSASLNRIEDYLQALSQNLPDAPNRKARP